MIKIENVNGITIKQLKELVKDLPEVDDNGDDYQVWLEDSKTGLSNVCRSVWPLNKDINGQDIILRA